MNISIEELHRNNIVNTRTVNLVKKVIPISPTLDDVYALTFEELWGIPNMGRKSIEIIIHALDLYDYDLSKYPSYIVDSMRIAVIFGWI